MSAQAIAIVGLACRYPDAPAAEALWDLVLSRRQAFRRIPPSQFEPGDVGNTGLAAPAAASGMRAALIEGWSHTGGGRPGPAGGNADPARTLALETAARALADSGFVGGHGLGGERAGVIIGHTLPATARQKAALRLRWRHARKTLATALADTRAGAPQGWLEDILAAAERALLMYQPSALSDREADRLTGTIADDICARFGFHGGGHEVDGACSSSLLAVAAACTALTTGDLDFALAGGVDVGFDPFELSWLAPVGGLATGEVRIYDAVPTGCLPGEGCGIVALMRAGDAHATGVPVYADITGWGVSSAGQANPARQAPAGLLLALRRAYQRAAADPATVQLFEGHGAGTAAGDLTELTALATLCQNARRPAALGSIKANIGHTRAAAGIAGLIKAALAMSSGTLPPATGCPQPHPLLLAGSAPVRVLAEAQPWPAGPRLAGVTAMGSGGTSVHLVLCRADGSGGTHGRTAGPEPVLRTTGPAGPHGQPTVAGGLPATLAGGGWRLLPGMAAEPAEAATGHPPGAEVYAFSGDDPAALAAELNRIADIAAWFTDSECGDLACQQARSPSTGRLRTAFAAASAAQLAERARAAARLLTVVTPGRLHHEHGVFAGDGAAGRVVLLFPGQGRPAGGWRDAADQDAATERPANHDPSRAALRWLDRLGVAATVAVGHGAGEITALAWAGCLSEADAARLAARREQVVAGHRVPGTAMLSVAADTATARTLADECGLIIAAYNGPRAHLLAGSVAAVQAAADRAARDGIAAVRLAASSTCQPPVLSGCAAALRPVLASIAFSRPRRRLISAITGRELRPQDDIPALLCEQLTVPIRFHEAVRAAADGADLFCEVGPGRILAELAVQCCGRPAVSVGTGIEATGRRRNGGGRTGRIAATPGGGGAAGHAAAGSTPVSGTGASRSHAAGRVARAAEATAANAAAALFASGAAVSLRPIFAGRAARPVDIWRDRVFVTDPGCLDPATVTTGGGPRAPGSGADRTIPGTTGSTSAVASHDGAAPAPGASTDQATASGYAGPRGAPAGGGEPCEHDTYAESREHGDCDTVPGVAAWVRCFTEVTRPLQPTPAGTASGPWRVRDIGRQPFGDLISDQFTHDAAAPCVLAFVPDSGELEAGALLEAAREGIGCGRLVMITIGAGLDGFCRSLHAEHPELGLTLLRVPAGRAGPRAARPYAAADPGVFAEISLTDGDGTGLRAPALAPFTVAGTGATPLGPADVVLLTGDAAPTALTCAEALAGTGAAVAIIGGIEPATDPALRARLERLRVRACAGYETADITDADAVRSAVARLEERLGPVTTLMHACPAGPARRFADLAADDIQAQVRLATGGLANALAAIRPSRLRLVISFGSVPARYGLAGGCHHALASGVLREQTRRLASRSAACRALHVELPPVAASPIAAPTLPAPRTDATGTAAATAEAGGGRITPIPADEVGHLLVRLAATAGLPELIVVHGRAGLRPAELPPVPVPGRFLARIRVHYPGTELVADATLTPRTDPYLADYQIDGRATLPAVIGLEAMAQAAGALAGQPLRRAADVRLSAPVAAQADMTMAIRICALHHGDAVETVLRCAGSGYRIDHMRAVFPIPAGDAHQRGADDAQGSEDRDASGGGAQPAGPRPGGGPPAGGTATGIVDGTELYGSLCPHSGRFRRVAFLTELTSHSCRALIRGTDEAPWFGADLASGLLLGSPGINDAAIHVLQASVPQRRLTLAGCESVAAHGPAVTGAVQVRARERRTDGPGYVWDVDAVDGNGTLVVSWTGVRLTEAGPLHRTEPWPPALLAVYLERGAAALGLGPALRVTIHTEEVTAGEVNAGEAAAADAAANGHRAEAGHGDRTSQQAGIDQASRSHLDGLTLTVETAAGRAACAWVPADSGHDTALARAPVWGELREQLRDRLGEPDEIAAARLRTALDCLSKARLPADCAPVISHGAGDGWVLFRTAGAAVASTVVPVIGMTAPVVVAIMAAIAGGETCDPDARDQ